MNTKILTLLAATAAVLSASAAVRFDNLFCDHAVFQRGQPVPVWGYGATPGTRVKLTFGDRQAWALANADGMFRTRLPAMKAGGPYELVAKDSPDGKVAWCHVAGFDGVFHPAEANVEGDTLVVSSPKVLRPLHVRYAWAKNPEGANLYNKEGLPACAFRW